MPRIRKRSHFLAYVALSIVICGCSASPQTNQDAKRFNNLLVIGVGVDYEGRSRFERKLVSDLKAEGVNATALYVAAGGNKPIEREAIKALVEANGYDSVLISRVLSRDSETSQNSGFAGAKAVRKDGGAVNLFRYDYVDLSEPAVLDIKLSIRFSTELFAATDSQRVWAIEAEVSKKDQLEYVINEASETIVRRLKKDKLIGP